jgi:hypothetical protein
VVSKLKVYGWTGQGGREFERPANGSPQTREIVAARSKAEVRRIAGLAPSVEITETRNAAEVTTAIAEPGTVLWRPLDSRVEGFVAHGEAWPQHPELEHAADCGCKECNDGGDDFTDPAYPGAYARVQVTSR